MTASWPAIHLGRSVPALDHFALVEDDRESWRVAHLLPEVLLLVVCGTIGACDDFDDTVAWGEDNLPFLRQFLPWHHGIPGARWLRSLMNRIDHTLFSEIFRSWTATLNPDAPALVAIDGKTSSGSHDRGQGRAALHLVSAFATREKLVLAQQAVAEGTGEQTTIPLLRERLAQGGQLNGALVPIDAVACHAGTAQAVLGPVLRPQRGVVDRGSPAMPAPRRRCSSPAPIIFWPSR